MFLIAVLSFNKYVNMFCKFIYFFNYFLFFDKLYCMSELIILIVRW